MEEAVRALFPHLVSPLIGFGIIAYVLYSMGIETWELGVAWSVLGIFYYVVLTRVLRRGVTLGV